MCRLGERTRNIAIRLQIITERSPEEASLRYTRQGFWIGLPLALFFAAVAWSGVFYAARRIATERTVYRDGVLTTGTVVEKIRYVQTEEGEQAHAVIYAFQTPAGVSVRKKIRMEFTAWDRLRKDGPISIRYVPARPAMNLPDGWHMTRFFYLVGGIALLAALFFSIVVIGMLIKKSRGGYRGEPRIRFSANASPANDPE